MIYENRRWAGLSKLATATLLAASGLLGCDGSDSSPPSSSSSASPTSGPTLTCDDSMKTGFQPASLSTGGATTVTLVKLFNKGDPILLTGTASASTPIAANPICFVKLLVAPGNPGPASAPSTTVGIGIEVWLPAPANWNGRIQSLGNSGWAGGNQTSATAFATSSVANPWDVAGTEGAVAATTDTGHPTGNGNFAMNADGTINTLGWQQFTSLGIHEMTTKAKALATGYYGVFPKYSYWHGASTGGRQGLEQAQAYPTDFDGIIANRPAIFWTQTTTSQLYVALAPRRDFGGPFTAAQLSTVGLAAVNACDLVNGQHLGYLLNPSQCAYDPTQDLTVICSANGGTNTSAGCVTPAQALDFNKVWYGPTSDGSVPAPLTDNGFAASVSGSQKWWGYPRGSDLSLLYTGFSVGTDQVALSLQDPTLASPTFINQTGNGANLWQALSYAEFSNAFDRGLALQPVFGNINTSSPDLTAAQAHGTKILTMYGLSDNLIPHQQFLYYYNQVASKVGGLSALQAFYKVYLVPGQGHLTANGTANPNANPPVVPESVLYQTMTDWVEKGITPGRIDISSPVTTAFPVAKSRPICVYPLKATYAGGDINLSTSYTCS